MGTEDITQQTSMIDTTPDEGVRNIQGSQFFDVPTDIFREHKEQLSPQLTALERAPAATSAVAEYVKTSPDHAAAASPDVSKLSTVERIYGSIGQALSRPYGQEQELNDLYFKKMEKGGKLDEDDQLQLQSLESQSAQNFGQPDYHLNSWYEKAPGFVAGVASDLVATATKNKALMAGFIGVESGLGALAGAAGGPAAPVTVPAGAAAGAVTGAISGYVAAGIYDSYKSTAASSYRELSKSTKEDGTPLISEENRYAISQGVGIFAGGINYGASKLFMKNNPILQKLSGGNLARFVMNNPTAREALVAIGRSGTIAGGASSLTDISKTIANEIGQSTGDNSDLALTNGLVKAAQIIATNKPKTGAPEGSPGALTTALEAGGSGFTAGVVGHYAIEGFGRAVRKGATSVRDSVAPRVERDAAVPEGPARLNPGAEPSTPGEIVIEPEAPTGPKNDIQMASEILSFEDAIKTASSLEQNTGLHKLDPQQVRDIRAKMLKNAGFEKVYIDKEDLTDSAIGDSEKAQAIRKAIDPRGLLASQLNAPIEVDAHDFMDVVGQYPDVAEHARLYPEGPSPKSAKVWLKRLDEAKANQAELKTRLDIGEKSPEDRAYNHVKINPSMDDAAILSELGSQEVADAYLSRLDVNEVGEGADPVQIQAMRERVTTLRDQLPNDKSLKETMTEALNTIQPLNEVRSEGDYMMAPTMTDALRKAYPEKQVEMIDRGEAEIRTQTAELINESARYEMNELIDVTTEMANEAQANQEYMLLENDLNLALVEKFTNPQPSDFKRVDAAGTFPMAKKGYSIFAIDPKSLTDAQRTKYLDNPQLKNHRAFVKGGMPLDLSAQLVAGIPGEQLLDLMSRTPSREKIVQARVQANKAANAKRAADSVDLNHTAVAKAFNKAAEVHVNGMREIVNTDIASAKAGIRAIALPPPRVPELQRQARMAVSQMRLRDLKPKQFKQGEIKSQRKAVEAILKKDLLTAFTNKQAAALNAIMQGETHIAIGEANKLARYAKRFQTPEYKQMFKDAGKTLENAKNELLDTVNLRPLSEKNLEKLGAYQRYVRSSVEKGIGNFEIPEELSDIREQFGDMTVEQMRTWYARLRTLEKQARLKNKLYFTVGEGAQKILQVDEFAAKTVAELENHPEYKVGREIVAQGNISARNKAGRIINDLRASLDNLQYQLLKLDKGNLNGTFAKAVYGPIKGIGEHSNGGEAAKARATIALVEHFDKLIETTFSKEYSNLRNKVRFIEEFKDLPELNNGHVSDWELLELSKHLGNEGNRERLTNFGTDIDTIEKVIEKYTDDRFMRMAQGVWDTYASYRPEIEKMFDELGIEPPKWVEARPITMHGKVYPGGYYPFVAKAELSLEKTLNRAKMTVEQLDGETKVVRTNSFSVDQMTDAGHLKARTSTNRPANLGANVTGMTLHEMLHDLHMRRPLAQATKVLAHPKIAEAIARVNGLQSHNTMIALIENLGSGAIRENQALYNSTRILDAMSTAAQSKFVTRALAYNPKTFLVQFGSTIMAMSELGAKGAPHIASVMRTIVGNGGYSKELFDLAAEIHPPIAAYNAGIQSNTRDPLTKNAPTKNWTKQTKAMSEMTALVSDKAMHGLEAVDNRLKVTFALASYRKFTSGDAPGFPSERLATMSEEEIDAQAKLYASGLCNAHLTASEEIDRNVLQQKYKIQTKFFNDARNVMSATLKMTDHARWKFGEGDIKGGATALAGLFIFTTLTRAFEEYMRGIFDQEFGENQNPKTLGFYGNLASYVATSPFDLIYSNAPLARDIVYAMNKQQKTGREQQVQTMQGTMLTDAKDGIVLALNTMDYINGDKTFGSREQRKAANAASYFMPLPVNGLFKMVNGINNFDPRSLPFAQLKAGAQEFSDSLREVEKNHADQISPDLLDELKEMEKQINPDLMNEMKGGATGDEAAVVNGVPEDTYSIIEQIESGGDIYAKNPNSSAAGLYQFTTGTWADIMERAPDLGLTEDGRTSGNPTQQEKAIKWFTENNARRLASAGIATTAENLYAAHFLGVSKAVEVLGEDSTVKLKLIVGSDVMEANGFANSMKVSGFKKWVEDKVAKAREKQVAKLDN